jgi:hypothetical protein
MAFTLVSGVRDSRLVTPASAAVIAVGDVLQYDEAGAVIDGVSSDTMAFVAQEASASGETDPIRALKITPDAVWRVVPSAGTVGSTLQVGDACDITSGAAAVDMGATTNYDFLITGEEGTTALLGQFRNVSFGNSRAATDSPAAS